MSLTVRHHSEVNHVVTYSATNDGVHLHVECETAFPTSPKLAMFCCEKQLRERRVPRAGKATKHGKRTFLPCQPRLFDPVDQTFQTFTWHVPVDQLQFPCQPCYLAILSFDVGTALKWHTMVKKCPEQPWPAVRFDGSALFRADSLAAATAGVMSVSFWYRIFTDQGGSITWVTDPADTDPNDEFFSSINKPFVYVSRIPFEFPTLGDLGFGCVVDQSFGDWHHCCYVLDVAKPDGAKTGIMMIDRVSVGEVITQSGDPFTIFQNGLPFFYGGDTFGNNMFADISDLWIYFGHYADFGDPEKLDRFVTPDLKPVYLGEHGEIPVLSRPTIFGHGHANTFLQPNLGTGGPLVLVGALQDTDGPPA